MNTLEAGRTLLHFRIEKKLGQGSMGEVYRAIDTKLGRPVAIKLLPPWALSKPEAARRFREEARLASALIHPHIVTIHAVEEAEGHEFIVMEFVEGETLLERSRREPLEFPVLLTVGIQVSEALAAAHAIGLIHRDIKPANILITHEGQAKVTDFGLAKRFEAEAGCDEGSTVASFTQVGMVVGTPAYMSPEQTRGKQLDPRSDVFSLGVTLYQAATGRLPFEGPSVLGIMHSIATAEAAPPSNFRPDLPAEFDLILARALAKDPEDRWGLARDFADALRGLRGGVALSTAAVALPRAGASKGPHNLPVQLTSFIGRRTERTDVRRLFAAARLVTVMGAGGTGKTRLALQVAADMLAEMPDGAWLVELATLANPALVPQTAANALGVREEPGRPLEATLADAIASRTMLLVLDNCEHLAAACATLAAALLRACPKLRILVTSQEGLGVSGELLWRIPTLSVPDPRTAPSTSKEAAGRFEAIRLFVARAAAAHPGFVLTDANAPVVAQICHRLDGIPLAIELAASRVKMLAVEKILLRLTDRFQLLTGGSRTALPRQQTLRAAVDWSYELLSSKERTLLNRLGVFAGGCVLESAEEICGWDGLEAEDVLEYLTHLVDKSLVGPHEGADGGMRYGLLETIRAYAAERAREAGEADAVAERHAAYFLRLAEAVEPELQGPEQARWLDRLEEEHDNLRQAFQTLVPRSQAEAALRLCGALWRFWWVRGNLKEGRDWLDTALHLEGAGYRTLRRSKALRCASSLALTFGEDDAARALLRESLEIAREQEDKAEIAACLFELGNAANQHERLAEAGQFYAECLALQREIGDRRGTSLTLHNLAVVAEARQDVAEAHKLYREALALHGSLGNQAMEASTRNGLGVLAVAQGDLGTAGTHHQQALMIQRDLGDKRGIAFSLRELGAIVAEQGDISTACAHLAESMQILRELGDRQELAAAIEASAGVAAKARQGERALRLAGAALALREEMACPISRSDDEVLQGRLAGVRKALGAQAAQRCIEEGRVLGVEQAIELAIETGSEGIARSSAADETLRS